MSTDTKSNELVGTLMHSPVVSIDRDVTLRDAAVSMSVSNIGTLAVMDGPEIAGIVSERDVVRALSKGADPDRDVVGSVMSEQPRYLTEGEDARGAADVMLAAGIRHLPVLEEGELVGIVSMRDLVGALRSP